MDFLYEKNRIYALDENECIAEITFPEAQSGIVAIDHTYVSPTLRGKGIASQLVKAAYHEIKKQNKRARAICPYVGTWFEKNPEFKDILEK